MHYSSVIQLTPVQQISGEIIAVDERIREEPSLVARSPTEEGWIAKIRLKDPQELDDLLDEPSYMEFCSQIKNEQDPSSLGL